MLNPIVHAVRKPILFRPNNLSFSNPFYWKKCTSIDSGPEGPDFVKFVFVCLKVH